LKSTKSDKRALARGLAWAGVVGLVAAGGAFAFDPPLLPLQTTRVDFFSGGTVAGTLNESLISPQQCSFCHGSFGDSAPYDLWNASMMGQAARDPIFWAAFSVAQQDADFIGDF
jgi:hypothetical protein